MNLGDLINKCRFLLAEPSTRRFTQSDMANNASDAQRQLALELDHPSGSVTFNVAAGVQRFQMPAIMKMLRVYIIGPDGSHQELPGTDIFTIQGDIQETYDNTSQYVAGAPIQSPQWLVSPQQPYPVTVGFPVGGRVPTKSQFTQHSRPMYALDGGYIVFTVPPSTTTPTTQVQVDYIPDPPQLVVNSDPCLFPDIAKDCIAWKMVSYCRFSDQSSAVDYADAQYEKEKAKLQSWVYSIQATRPKSFVPVTMRTQFGNRGRYRR